MSANKSMYVQWNGKDQPPPKEKWQYYVKTREGYDPNKNGLEHSRWAPHNRHKLTQEERDKITANNKAEQLHAKRQQAHNSNKSNSTSQSINPSKVAATHLDGSLASSRWASKACSPPLSTKVPSAGRSTAIKIVNPAMVGVKPVASNVDSSYIPPHLRGQVPTQKTAPDVHNVIDTIKIAITSVRSLSPEAPEFKPSFNQCSFSVRSLSPEAPEFKPSVKEGVVSARSLSPKAPEFKPSFKECIATSRSLTPKAASFRPSLKECFVSVRSLSPESAEFNPTPHGIVEPVSTEKVAPHLQIIANSLKEHAVPIRSQYPEDAEFKSTLQVITKPISAQNLTPQSQDTVSEGVTWKTDSPKADASYIPPHMRGSVPVQQVPPNHQFIAKCLKSAVPAPIKKVAPHLQVTTNSSYAACHQALPNDTAKIAPNVQSVPIDTSAKQSTIFKQESPKEVHLPTPQKDGGLTSAADYNVWLKQKIERDLVEKKVSIAKRAALQAQGPTVVRGDTWRKAPTGQIVAVARHNHYQVDVNQGPASFETFLEEKDAAPIENGKKYTKLSKLGPEASPFIVSKRTPSPIYLGDKALVFTTTPPPSLPSGTEEKLTTAALDTKSTLPTPKRAGDNKGENSNMLALCGRSLSPKAVEFTPNNIKECIAPVHSLSPKAAIFSPAPREVDKSDVEIFEPVPEEVISVMKARPGLAASRWAPTANSKHLPKSGRQKAVEVEVLPEVVPAEILELKVANLEGDVPNIIEPNTVEPIVDQPKAAKFVAQTKSESKHPVSAFPPPITPALAITDSAAPSNMPIVATLPSENPMNASQAFQVDPKVVKFKEWMANRNSAGDSASAKTDSQTSAQNRINAWNQAATGKASAQISMDPDHRGLDRPPRGINAPTHAKGTVRPQETVIRKATVEQGKEAFLYSAPSSGGWGNKPTATDLNNIITEAALVPANNGEKLTKDVINEKLGPSASNNNSNSFDAKISEEGVATTSKENVRNAQGKDPAEELLDWDNSWRPAPCDWEDRANFDNSYMTAYIISDWQPNLPQGIVNFNLKDPNFETGRCPVKNLDLEPEYEHEKTVPDYEASADKDASLFQTSENAAFKYNERERLRQEVRDALAVIQVPRDQLQYMDLGPHEFAPVVAIYLRPAQPSDAAQIAAIYNHYINTNPTEDLEPVTEAVIKQFGRTSKEEKLPFLVAVEGCAPVATPTRSSQKVVIPPNETILGFSVARTWAYGINGLRSGRSRLTVNLEVFVRPDYLRKGIGRSLLDRLLQCCSPGYAGRDGYSWVNPNPGDDVYGKPGGIYYLYSLVIQIIAPAGKAKEKDDDFLWKREFLRKYWFDEEATLKGFSRSSRASQQPKFFDNVIFTKLAALDGEVPPFA